MLPERGLCLLQLVAGLAAAGIGAQIALHVRGSAARCLRIVDAGFGVAAHVAQTRRCAAPRVES